MHLLPRSLVVGFLALTLGLSACSSDDPGTSDPTSGSSSTRPSAGAGAPAEFLTAPFTARGGIRYAYVVDAARATKLRLLSPTNEELEVATTDRFGSLIFRDLEPGDGYRVATVAAKPRASDPFTVLDESATPAASLYDQPLKAGLNYATMRDGIELAMTVRLPAGMTLEDGPFPTVIEYSGYQVAAPGNLLDSVLNGGTDPLAPATATAVGSLITPLLGYATVSVQMRGSGCSGGDMDLFDRPTIYDGYDAVEIVAAQSWAANHKVGMVGISFSGITQLFTAGTRPPSLAAIAPLSVLNDLYESPGYPGGITNSGFAASWVAERARDAEPAPGGGQPYAAALIKQGDKRCRNNQKLRLQTRDNDAILGTDPFRTPELFDHRSTEEWAKLIDVPVFIVGAFQDEQTGGMWPRLVTAMKDNPRVWATMLNGTHVDSLGPGTLSRWAEFLSIYVAQKAPSIPDGVSTLAPTLYQLVAQAEAQPLPEVRYGDRSYADAKAAFERDPRARVYFDNGGDPTRPGALDPLREVGYDAWPPSEAAPQTLAFGPNGALSDAAPASSSSERYVSDPSARPADDLPDGQDPWWALPAYEWAPVADGHGLGFASAPLAADLTAVGPASADLFVKSSAVDTDLQVTISEVRPDGYEMLVQSGWLRASRRALDEERSTDTDPRPTFEADDAAELPADEFTLVRVGVFPFAHTFRAGSRVRLTIQAPGGDRAIWQFASIDGDSPPTNEIGIGGDHASQLVLSVVPSAEAGPIPPCPSNRGQPCRRYVAAENGG